MVNADSTSAALVVGGDGATVGALRVMGGPGVVGGGGSGQGSASPSGYSDQPENMSARGAEELAETLTDMSRFASSVIPMPGSHKGQPDHNVTDNSLQNILWSIYKSASSVLAEDLSQDNGTHAKNTRGLGGLSQSSVGADNITVLEESPMENLTTRSESGVTQGGHLIGVLMGSTTTTHGPADETHKSFRNSSSASVFREAVSFSMEASGVDSGSPEEEAEEFQRLLLAAGAGRGVSGASFASYTAALTHNLTSQHLLTPGSLANLTGGGDRDDDAPLLFANYPPHLLDFAVFCCVLFIVLGVPGNLITIIALVKCKKVSGLLPPLSVVGRVGCL